MLVEPNLVAGLHLTVKGIRASSDLNSEADHPACSKRWLLCADQ